MKHAIQSVLLLAVVTLGLAGCKKALTFEPQTQPDYGRFSADYELRDDLLVVKVWAGDYLLADADIMRSPSEAVEPVSIHYPTGNTKIVTNQRGPEVQRIVETGDKIERDTPARPPSTYIVFRRTEVGDKPWRLRLRVPGQPNPLYIMLTEHPDDAGQ